MRRFLVALAAGIVIGFAPIVSDAEARPRGGGFYGGGARVGVGGFHGGRFVGARGFYGPRVGWAGRPFYRPVRFAHRPFYPIRRLAWGAPFAVGAYAYGSCYRLTWTPWGWQPVNVCYAPVGYGYGSYYW